MYVCVCERERWRDAKGHRVGACTLMSYLFFCGGGRLFVVRCRHQRSCETSGVSQKREKNGFMETSLREQPRRAAERAELSTLCLPCDKLRAGSKLRARTNALSPLSNTDI